MEMKNKTYDLSRYTFSPGEPVLIDANIWLYLFPPPRNPQKSYVKAYSKGFANLLSVKAKPILDPMVLSEYLNRYCRIIWSGFKNAYPEFKDFRRSADFSLVENSVSADALRIMLVSQVHTTPSDETSLKQALIEFATGLIDFNDALIVNVCRKNGYKLLTNDADFQTGGIEVLTVNEKLLLVCVNYLIEKVVFGYHTFVLVNLTSFLYSIDFNFTDVGAFNND